jgi:hypothetical protein
MLTREIDRLVEQLVDAFLGDRHVVGVVIVDLLRFDDLAEVPIRPAGYGNLWIGPSFLVSGSALELRRRIGRRVRDLADHLSD